MLSIVDLLDAGTLSLELAAYLRAVIGNGGSFIVGASPGGAGKTTVMGALLNFLPADAVLRPAEGWAALERARSDTRRLCSVCHEIGSGDYYAYLWNGPLRGYFELPKYGHILAANLHADTPAETWDQICRQNRVPEKDFRQVALLIFIEVTGGWKVKREISSVFESNGASPHRRIYGDGGLNLAESRLATEVDVERAHEQILELQRSGARSIESVRRAIVESECE